MMKANEPPRLLRLLWLLAAVAVAVILFLLVTSLRIVHEAGKEELLPADAIIVFGAAEYAGHPSPVWRARLDRAYDLFMRKLAPVVITTGGAGADPRYSEGEVGRNYLSSQGVPDARLIAETQSPDTAESARRVATILRANQMGSCLAVSDGYHMFRIKHMLGHEGITVVAAPRPNSKPPSFWKRQSAVWHEIGSYTAWLLHLT
jgi:uncharacterized SAM-binding protein YcdF (DUF218 family)